jgi:hypothetical protein
MKLERIISVHKRVREWLMKEWDPIGVSECPEAFNEYYGYERDIADLLLAEVSEMDLARHLVEKEEHMGLTPDPERASRAARRLKALFRESMKEPD